MPGPTPVPYRAVTWIIVATGLVVLGLFVAVRALEPSFAFFPARGEDDTPAAYRIPFTAATLETADRERVHLWSLVHPDPIAVVVYFHGNGGNLSVWAPILAGVYEHRLTVHAVDYRGYGKSTGRPSERGLYRDVDAVVRWAAERVAPGVPVIYWGRSLGATMASYAATVRRPDGIVIESGFPDARAVLRGAPPIAFLALFSSYRFPTARFLAQVDCPVLVLHGDADSVVPYALGRQLFEGLRRSKEFVTIRGGDHNDLRPADPQAYWRAVEQFVVRMKK